MITCIKKADGCVEWLADDDQKVKVRWSHAYDRMEVRVENGERVCMLYITYEELRVLKGALRGIDPSKPSSYVDVQMTRNKDNYYPADYDPSIGFVETR